MITVKEINPQLVHVYGPAPDEKFLGKLNEYEFADLRAQIAEEGAEGYSIIYRGEVILIDKDGRFDKPVGLFDSISNSLTRILRHRYDVK